MRPSCATAPDPPDRSIETIERTAIRRNMCSYPPASKTNQRIALQACKASLSFRSTEIISPSGRDLRSYAKAVLKPDDAGSGIYANQVAVSGAKD